MNINVKRFGFACGITGVVLYLGCVLLMATVGRDGTITFFNSLFHGIEISPVIRMNASLTEAFMGIVQTFILGWLTGACVACFYNLSVK